MKNPSAGQQPGVPPTSTPRLRHTHPATARRRPQDPQGAKHLDLETDDVETEVQRLEQPGATLYDHQQERGTLPFWFGEAGSVSRCRMPFLRQIRSNITSQPFPNRSVNCFPLALDLAEPPVGGWVAYLKGRGIEVLTDDVGRASVSRSDARQLLDEKREAEIRRQEAAERQERQFIAADQAWREQLSPGIPWWEFPDGVSPQQAWAQVARDEAPRRRTLLEDKLAGEEGTMVYHSLASTPDGDEA